MAYLLRKDRPNNSFEEWRTARQRYSDHLESIKDKLPQSTYQFATAEWHYDGLHHRSPHDGWLEFVTVREPSSGDRNQYRTIEIHIRLLAAYHDGYIDLSYFDVRSYSLTAAMADFHPDMNNKGHQDWLYDEIRLSDRGNVLHEIEWSRGDHWVIECKDIRCDWTDV